MITNAGLVAGVIIGLVFLLAGLLLLMRGSTRGGGMVTLGALLYLGSQLYGLIELRPFIGRPFDQDWSEQISAIVGLSTVGLLICAAGIVAHALAFKKL
ncbi:MAG TPA: hypothetical protein VIQ55_06760 [Burkholderiales bacterium]